MISSKYYISGRNDDEVVWGLLISSVFLGLGFNASWASTSFSVRLFWRFRPNDRVEWIKVLFIVKGIYPEDDYENYNITDIFL